ncbi:hypothetical protein [Amycolatopsis jiangsuensis]|uniref:Secreted protein n=1 Tax=Amycolatopsis jiangsuensis TaxID=1181879 RepID=A0A840J1A3_9PSEU|nr:hypothetical protein [Amycolatopsis jiangsuensis]MBB4687168.1 hypothetical protein [Amycolatopsis jiangsuensis]
MGAVLAGALISLAVVPAANAQTEADSTAPSTGVTTTEAPPASSETPDTTAPDSSVPQSTSDTSLSGPGTTTEPAESTGPTGSAEPTEPTTTTSDPEETTALQEPPYEDDTAYGVDLDGDQGLVVIACAAGEPTGLRSKDFDVVDGPQQDETDGRYWAWIVQRHEGISFQVSDVYADWTCGGKPAEGEAVPPAGGAGAGSAGTTGGHGDSQVKYAPKGGIETGFGGMAA